MKHRNSQLLCLDPRHSRKFISFHLFSWVSMFYCIFAVDFDFRFQIPEFARQTCKALVDNKRIWIRFFLCVCAFQIGKWKFYWTLFPFFLPFQIKSNFFFNFTCKIENRVRIESTNKIRLDRFLKQSHSRI